MAKYQYEINGQPVIIQAGSDAEADAQFDAMERDRAIVETAAKARTGLGVSGIKGAFGLSDVARGAGERLQQLPVQPVRALGRTLSALGGTSPQGEERANMLAAMNEAVEEGGGVAKGAQLVGNIAQAGALGGPLTKGATAVIQAVLPLTRAAKAAIAAGKEVGPRLLARLTGSAGAGAAESAALTPEEDKLRAAGYGAAGGGAGELVSAAGGRVVGGLVKPSETGEKILAQGIQPTIAEGGGGGVMGKVLGIPGEVAEMLGKTSTTGAEFLDKAKKQVTDVLEKYGAKEVPEVVGRGKFITGMKEGFDTGYSSILKNKEIPLDKDFAADATIGGLDKIVNDEAKKTFAKEMEEILPTGDKIAGGDWKEKLSNIRALEREARKDYANNSANTAAKQRADAYQEVEKHLQDTLRNSGKLSKAELASLDELDKAYSKFKTLHKGATYSEAGEVLEPKEFVRAVEARTPDEMKAELTGPFQELSEPLKELGKGGTAGERAIARHALYKALGAAGLLGAATYADPTAGLGGLGLGAILASKGTAKALMGQGAKQKALSTALRKISPYSQVGAVTGRELSENE